MNSQYIVTPFFLDDFDQELEDLKKPGWEVIKPDLPPGDRQNRMAALYRPLRDAVARIVTEGHRPVSVAGDCCATIGVLAGLQRAGVHPTLVWFDAHGDFNTWETTPSGFLGGMPLAMLVGRGEQTMVEGVAMDNLDESRVILTDGRDLDPQEREALETSNVIHLDAVDDLLDHPLPQDPLWIHFDVDVLNTSEMPAVSYPAPGGPSAAALRSVLEHLASSYRIAALSLSSWNPSLDQGGHSRDLSLELLDVLAG